MNIYELEQLEQWFPTGGLWTKSGTTGKRQNVVCKLRKIHKPTPYKNTMVKAQITFMSSLRLIDFNTKKLTIFMRINLMIL